jgi:hypothetical protein
VLRHLIVVDYQEGAGGEFVARFLSAHFGLPLAFDQQADPDQTQKWLNSQSIVAPAWSLTFKTSLRVLLELCASQNIDSIAVPYHLYKWPQHVGDILDLVPHARFVRINCDQYLDRVNVEFQRKVQDRAITNFKELQFLLKNKDREFIKSIMTAFKEKTLTYKDIFPATNTELKTLPSNDIKIDYGDFFCNFDQTASAYEQLCNGLNLVPNIVLLSALLERNKKNQHDLERYLSTL